MKRIYIYLALCGLLAASCTGFLKEESRTEIEKNDFLLDASEAETVLLGAYRGLIEEGTYALNLSIMFSMGTDMSQVEGSTTESWRITPTNAFPATQSEVQESWQALYEGVFRTNDFIERCAARIDTWTPEDRNKGVIYIAEARALRALYYFELVRRWGNIPLMTSTAQSEMHPSTFTQAAPQDVYAFIEEDLLYAVETLPYAKGDTFRKDNSYRFSKGAAMGLLAKVYATWAGYPVQDSSKWEEAAKMAQKLIYSGKHDLLPDYQTLWENTCNGIWDPTESLIEVSFYSPTTGDGNADPCGRIGKWNGVKTTSVAGVRGRCAANMKVVHSFVLDWRQYPDDARRDLSVANYQYKDDYILLARGASDTDETAQANDLDQSKQQKNKQSYTPAKWDIVKYVNEANNVINDDKSNVNWYILRYSDVLLLYAEALNEWKGGPTADAYAAINKVRARGYARKGGYELSGLDQEGFRQAVRQERAFELAFEGHRKLDLIRWGIYYETIQETDAKLNAWWESDGTYNYVVAKHTVKGKHELLPIPQRELDLCTQFKQNPNW